MAAFCSRDPFSRGKNWENPAVISKKELPVYYTFGSLATHACFLFHRAIKKTLLNTFKCACVELNCILTNLENTHTHTHPISGIKYSLSVQPVCSKLCTRYHFSINKIVSYIINLLTMKLVSKYYRLVLLSQTRQELLVLACSSPKTKTAWRCTCLQVKAYTQKEKEPCNLKMRLNGYKSGVSTFRMEIITLRALRFLEQHYNYHSNKKINK